MKKVFKLKEIDLAIKKRKNIVIISYTMSDKTEQKIDKVIERILYSYKRDDLKYLFYTCVKELAINGIKANLKRLFFEENCLNIENPQHYEHGLVKYKETFNERIIFQKSPDIKKKGSYVKICFYHDPDGIRVEVVNNTSLTLQEESRLRDKLCRISKYENMIDFYEDNQDNTEGAGMGLALIATLLKNSGINPELFRIYTKDQHTIARIEFPLTENYISVRRDAAFN